MKINIFQAINQSCLNCKIIPMWRLSEGRQECNRGLYDFVLTFLNAVDAPTVPGMQQWNMC